MKVKCSECYFVFKVSESRKYIDCPECKAELNSEKLEIVKDDQKPKQTSIFEKALKDFASKAGQDESN